jgi:hypothetical protein
VLKAAKKLKSYEIKNIYIDEDRTETQRAKLKELLKKRKDENDRLEGDEDFYWGIRGDSVVKVSKNKK